MSIMPSVPTVDPGQFVLIRGLNPNVFRSGEWARIVGVCVVNQLGVPARPCFDVEFLDGRRDWWPIEDEAAEYEFKPSIRTK